MRAGSALPAKARSRLSSFNDLCLLYTFRAHETSLPTDAITRKEIDIRGARTSAGEFEEAIELIYTKKVDVQKILTKVISIDEVPDTIVDIEKNPGDYMKVVVMIGEE